MLTNIISLTDAWGVAHGGINSFNTDFCKALGRGHPSDYRLTCVVRSASQEDITDAKIHGVHLVSSDPDQTEKGLSVEGILGALTAQGRRPDKNDVIIGHDIISGEVACAVAKQTGARSAVIRHMIYQAYHTEKSGKAESTNAKHNEQRQLFKQCDLAFAVGPYMADHTQNFFALEDTRTVVTLIAGLEDIEVNHKPKVSFNGITFGRINAQDDIIKQGILAVTAFAKAVHSYAEMTSASVQSTFHLYGLSDTEKEKQQELDKIKSAVKSQTKGWINIVPAPYTLNRNQLIQDLQEKHVCLMLSIHEGFGLVGWEAIAAGVPLVVSENSGLYKYLHQLGLQENVAHIHLGFNNDDKSPSADNIEAVAQCVRSIKADWENWQKRAINLRTALKNQHNCSWESTAETFLDGCNIQREHTRTALLDAPSLGPLNGPLEAWLSKDTEPVLALGGEDTTSAPLQHWLTMWCRRASRLLIPISLTDPESDPRDLLLNALAPSRERSSIGLSESVRQHLSRQPTVVVLQRLTRASASDHPGLSQLLTLATSGDLGATKILLLGHPPTSHKSAIPVISGNSPSGSGSTSDDQNRDRLSDLPPAQTTLLQALSLTQHGLTLSNLSALLADSEDKTAPLLSGLRAQNLVEESMPGRWRAVAQTAQAVLEPISDKHRAQLHRRLADHLKATAYQTATADAHPDTLWPALEWLHHKREAGHASTAFTFFYKHLKEALYYRHGRYAQCQELLSRFFSSTTPPVPILKGQDARAKLLLYMGQCLGQSGHPDQALAFLSAHNALRQEKDQLYELSRGHGAMALCLYAMGRFNQAYAHLTQRLKACQDLLARLPDSLPFRRTALLSMAVSHRTMAKIRIAEEEWDEAANQLDQAEAIYTKAGASHELVKCYIYRARISLHRDKSPEESTELWQQARRILTQASGPTGAGIRPDARDIIDLDLLNADIRRLTKDLPRAEQIAQQALSRSQSMRCADLEVDGLLSVARARVALTDWDRAEGTAQEAFELAKMRGYMLKQGSALVVLAEIAIGRDDGPKAQSLLDEATGYATREAPPHEPMQVLDEITRVRGRIPR